MFADLPIFDLAGRKFLVTLNTDIGRMNNTGQQQGKDSRQYPPCNVFIICLLLR